MYKICDEKGLGTLNNTFCVKRCHVLKHIYGKISSVKDDFHFPTKQEKVSKESMALSKEFIWVHLKNSQKKVPKHNGIAQNKTK